MLNPQNNKQANIDKQIITQQEMISLSSQCYILLERYKLKTNLVGINSPKDLIDYNYNFLEQRMIDRYDRIYETLKQGIQKLQANFAIAQANTLRTLNNIFRNYRRRVGTLSNQPLANFKYNRYDKQEKLLLQSIIYKDKENYHQIKSFKQELQRNIQLGTKEIQEKYRPNQKIKENYHMVFDVIDKTECHTYKYYENFQRSMLTTVHTLQAHFDKLNAYLSVWENVGSTKAYQVKSAKQIDYDQKTYQSDRNRRYFDDESEQQLEQLMKNSPQHSAQREEYRKRLSEIRRYNSEKQKKLDNVGKMYSKRRNRAGILVNKSKDITILQWVINLENTKVPYSHQDQFKNYRADNEQNDYRLTLYEIQKPMKTIQEIKSHLQKYRQGKTLNFQWWYDRFGKDGHFDLITSQSQQIQKRIQFEFVRQTQLQNTDDRRKRELLQKQNYQMREGQRKDYLHIGYLHVHDKTQLQWLMERSYNTQYLPGMLGQDSSDISFSDQEISQKDYFQVQKPKNIVVVVKEAELKHQKLNIKEEEKIDIQEQLSKQIEPIQQIQQNQNDQQQNLGNMQLQEQLIKVYFKEYSKKIVRKESQPEYRKTEFLYYKQLNDVNWQILQKYLNYENIFILTPKSIVFFNRIFSAAQQKIKCNIFTVDQDRQDQQKWQQSIKQQIKASLKNCSLVTVIFHPIYVENESVTTFMIGLLITLIREGKMPQDFQLKDYVNEGREIIQDFNQYFFPRDNTSPKSLFRRYKTNIAQQKLKKEEPVNETLSLISTVNTSIVKKQAPKDKPQKEEENPKPIKALPTIEQKIVENDVFAEQNLPYKQKQLKKSDSRQFLNNLGTEIQQAHYQQDQKQQNQDEEEQYL